MWLICDGFDETSRIADVQALATDLIIGGDNSGPTGQQHARQRVGCHEYPRLLMRARCRLSISFVEAIDNDGGISQGTTCVPHSRTNKVFERVACELRGMQPDWKCSFVICLEVTNSLAEPRLSEF
ncbi:hypothetical protein GCM10022286_17780 [Gryllotalpicola daejeonensis]|uniref:Uncharacterized protein n=1 Tax=Gryllotalpicola daejeonensis TaxID=993087 RepID=A0ABP7ZJZ9_9MICO